MGNSMSQGRHIGGKGCVEAPMCAGVIADDVEEGHGRLARVMQVCKTVRQSRPKMEKGCGRLFHHASISICGSGRYSFEETEHGTHARYPVECLNEMHFGGSRVGEADLYSAI